MKKSKLTILTLFLFNIANAEPVDYLQNNNQSLYFIKIGNLNLNIYDKPNKDSEVLTTLKEQDTGEIYGFLNSEISEDGNLRKWFKVRTKRKTGFLHSTQDIFVTTSDLINSERPAFDPYLMIHLPTETESSYLTNNQRNNFIDSSNNFSILMVPDKNEYGKIIFRNKTTGKYYSFKNSEYNLKTSFENKLIFKGIKNSGDGSNAQPVTLILAKNKYFEINFSFENSKEYYDWIEGYNTPFNEVKILKNRIIFLYHEEYSYEQKKTPDCQEYNLDFYNRCLLKSKNSDYFLAIQNFNEEPIFDFYEDKGIPRKYLKAYMDAEELKKDNQ